MTNSVEPDSDADCPGIVCRPPNQLHDLPVQYRWEVSRRHSYYLVFWSEALLYRQGNMESHPAQQLLRHAAMLMLSSIGVTGEPVAPGTSFEKLDVRKFDPAFFSGAVQPMTLRSVAVMLIQALPQAERLALGSILAMSGDTEYAMPGDTVDLLLQKGKAIGELMRIPSPALDSCPVAPLFYIHMGASQRTIVQDVEEQVRRWKELRGISERRVPTTKLQMYLDVWDRREGWIGDSYKRSQERTFIDIAKELKLSLSTVAKHYRSAFQMITGHGFLPDLWWRIFAPLKMSEWWGNPAEILSAPIRHWLRSPVRRPVPESVVTPSVTQVDDWSMVEQMTAIHHDPHAYNTPDLLIDLQDLIAKGLSNEEIARRLELGDPKAIAYLRYRLPEFGEM